MFQGTKLWLIPTQSFASFAPLRETFTPASCISGNHHQMLAGNPVAQSCKNLTQRR